MATPRLGKPSFQGFAFLWVQFAQGLKLGCGALLVLLMEQALDQEHPREAEEGIEEECLTPLMQRAVPVAALHMDIS
jgi:hypothetical protein